MTCSRERRLRFPQGRRLSMMQRLHYPHRSLQERDVFPASTSFLIHQLRPAVARAAVQAKLGRSAAMVPFAEEAPAQQAIEEEDDKRPARADEEAQRANGGYALPGDEVRNDAAADHRAADSHGQGRYRATGVAAGHNGL